MNIDEFLAVKVMGDLCFMQAGYPHLSKTGKRFKPSTNIEQAEMCLRKCEHCEINGSDSRGWYVYVELPNSEDLYGESVKTECDTLEESISLACARAAGWSDNDEN